MRVCVTHWKPATEILTSKMTGTEYDLCAECLEKLHGLLVETAKPEKIQVTPKPSRNRRSDAGKPRTPRTAARSGGIEK